MEVNEFEKLSKELFVQFCPDFDTFWGDFLKDVANVIQKYPEDIKMQLLTGLITHLCLRKIGRAYATLYDDHVEEVIGVTMTWLSSIVVLEKESLKAMLNEQKKD